LFKRRRICLPFFCTPKKMTLTVEEEMQTKTHPLQVWLLFWSFFPKVFFLLNVAWVFPILFSLEVTWVSALISSGRCCRKGVEVHNTLFML
jgi:hypothetical protein